jgi:hypothetical protein
MEWATACERAARWDLPFPADQGADNGNWGQIPPAYSLHVAEALRARPDAESVLIAKIVGPLLLRLEAWGRNAGFKNGDARHLLADLFDAAGPHRQHHMPALFEMCVRKAGVSDRDKVEWLRRQVDLIRRNDAYFPRERPEIRDDTFRNAALDVIRQAPDQTTDIATLMSRLGRTRDSIVGLTRRLVDERLIVRTGPGQFTLPGNGEAHVPAHEQIETWFKMQPPGTESKAVELAAALGRTRQAIDSALHGHGQLIARGLVVAVKRGVFKLAE